MSAGDGSQGALRPAAPDGARPPPVVVPTREPLRWLAAAEARSDAARRGGKADAAAADKAEGEGDLVYVHFEDGEAPVRLDAGAGFEFRDLDTDVPTLRLEDGSTFVGRWEEAVGTCVVFTEEEAAAPGAPPRRVRHAGHTEARLVMRRAPLAAHADSAEA